MVNKALCLFQWKQDFDGAEALCAEALKHDEACDVAVATYAQLLLQRNKIHEAVEMFRRGSALARTEPELVNSLNFELATSAQIAFIDNYRACEWPLIRRSVSDSVGTAEQAARLGLLHQGAPVLPTR
jgi:import receptor subunit TOM70